MLNASNGVTMPGWGEYHLAGKVNFLARKGHDYAGKSSFSLMTHYSPRDVYWTRTNSETYNFNMSKAHIANLGGDELQMQALLGLHKISVRAQSRIAK